MSDSKNEELLRWKLANTYFQANAFTQAEPHYRRILDLSPQHIGGQKKLAACLLKQGKHPEARSLLENVLGASFDHALYDLLEKIRQTKAQDSLPKDSIEFALATETSYIRSSGIITPFVQFFLNRADLSNIVPAVRLQAGHYVFKHEADVRHDVNRAETLATALTTKHPAARAAYYLIAAKILVAAEGDQNSINRYLYLFFACRGDASIENNLHADTARQFYLEAAILYAQLPVKQRGDEQEAVQVIVHYLDAIFDTPADALLRQNTTIKNALQGLIAHHPDIQRSFASIVELIIHTRFAEQSLLAHLYSDRKMHDHALNYFQQQGLIVQQKEKTTKKGFITLWNRYQKVYFDRQRSDLITLHSLLYFEFNPRWLKDHLLKIATLVETQRWGFKLNHERLRRIWHLLNRVSPVLEASSYEIQDDRIETVLQETDGLRKEIETSPTQYAIEELLPLLKKITDTTEAYQTQCYERSKPQINLRLPQDFDTVTPVDEQVEIQMVIENAAGRSPAEAFCLIISPPDHDQSLHTAVQRYPYTKSVLRGGQQDIMALPMQVPANAMAQGAFSFTVQAMYQTVRGHALETLALSFQIHIRQRRDFSDIINPYSVGAIVQNLDMVYGRTKLIQTIVRELQQRQHADQGKSYVIYGQKRTGKSTILYYLGEELAKIPGNLVLNLGNLGEILHQDQVSIYDKFLWKIITALKKALGRNQPTDVCFPANSAAFFSHPSPHMAFIEILDAFLSHQQTLPEAQSQRIILLIDEFTYLYPRIKAGILPKELMTHWKAFLQANYFHAVLVGQDFMPKFIAQFQNAFAAMQKYKVTYLARADAEALMQTPILLNGKSRYREQAVANILELTAGSPFYLQIFCKRLVEYLNEKKTDLITEVAVREAKALLVDELDVGHFDNLYNAEDGDSDTVSANEALPVLHQIAVNSGAGSCPRSMIDGQDDLDVDTILNTLVQRAVIERDRDRADFVQIKVGLFKAWLITNGI